MRILFAAVSHDDRKRHKFIFEFSCGDCVGIRNIDKTFTFLELLTVQNEEKLGFQPFLFWGRRNEVGPLLANQHKYRSAITRTRSNIAFNVEVQ